ncbi:MAG: NYN domain-containing protein [Tepidiformaceae bacterium]
MVLNIFPRGSKPAAAAANEAVATLPEPSEEVMESLNTAIDGSDGSDEPKKRPTRRGSRGGRGRARTNGADALDDGMEQEVADAATEEAEPAPAKAPRRPRGAKAPTAVAAEANESPDEVAPAEGAADDAPAPAPRARRGSPRRPVETPERETATAPEGLLPMPASEPRSGRTGPATSDGNLVRAIEQQTRQIEQLIEAVRRGGGAGGGIAAAPPARVGVFVDAANVELASDRLRARFDWRKILDMLTRDRQLVRAIAYSPVHDDPGVSIETQRFVEPFLDKGYKVVTKPLKRFQDGTIKANVDIEMALDVMEMLDRLDVVCLISGDGDFQRLVEVVQSKGVRVEVVAVGNSTAGNLRKAADHYIDLQQHLRDIRV